MTQDTTRTTRTTMTTTTADTTTRPCPAHGCSREVHANVFMCGPDWYSIRPSLRDAILREYRACKLAGTNPPHRYVAVARRAIAEVAWASAERLPDALALSARSLAASEKARAAAVARGDGDPLEEIESILPEAVLQLALAPPTESRPVVAAVSPPTVSDARRGLFGTMGADLAPRGSRLKYTMKPREEGGHLHAFTEAGHLIGNEAQALWLSEKGVAPEMATPSSTVCSVGFCARTGKWWGWHHRTAKSFGVGDVAAWGKPETTPTLTPEQLARGDVDLSVPVGFVAKTLADARRMAVAFARASGAR